MLGSIGMSYGYEQGYIISHINRETWHAEPHKTVECLY